MGSDASTDVECFVIGDHVSDTVSSSDSSNAASAPILRASAVAASASDTASTSSTPAFDTVWRNVGLRRIGQAEPCRSHPIA